MKTVKCSSCNMDVKVHDGYKPQYCCEGILCGCMGSPINPVFCDKCEKEIMFENKES